MMINQASSTMEKEKPKNVLKKRTGTASAEDDPMNGD